MLARYASQAVVYERLGQPLVKLALSGVPVTESQDCRAHAERVLEVIDCVTRELLCRGVWRLPECVPSRSPKTP